MKFFLIVFFILIGVYVFGSGYQALSFVITMLIGSQILLMSNETFVFREWALFLYAWNYLLAPSVIYNLQTDQVIYGMKISAENYFALSIPGFMLFMFGMYAIPNRLFQPSFKKSKTRAVVNEGFLVRITIIGTLLSLVTSLFPSELSFFVYLISMIRFVGSFALFSLNKGKYRWMVFVVLFIELYFGFLRGMYHDALMWLIFFVIFYVYTNKPSMKKKIFGAIGLMIFILFIQSIKSTYREKTWNGEEAADLTTIAQVSSESVNSNLITGEVNLLGTLNRGNQAWIFASTVDHMDRVKDFQGLNIVRKYFESALLPRFLAPNKIKSGDKEIFNQFSGHSLNEGTSMGLGVFADGYVAYGTWGVYLFGFTLGLIFSLTFKLIEKWTIISPIYVLMLLPMLNYAVRPDCELQTTINHLVKSIIVFGFLVSLTKHRFTIDSDSENRKLGQLSLVNNRSHG